MKKIKKMVKKARQRLAPGRAQPAKPDANRRQSLRAPSPSPTPGPPPFRGQSSPVPAQGVFPMYKGE
jgi:hypothetical protein